MLGDRIRALREERGWRTADLARATTISHPMLHQIEAGDSQPSLGLAALIASAFGLTLDGLIQNDPDNLLLNKRRIELVRERWQA